MLNKMSFFFALLITTKYVWVFNTNNFKNSIYLKSPIKNSYKIFKNINNSIKFRVSSRKNVK